MFVSNLFFQSNTPKMIKHSHLSFVSEPYWEDPVYRYISRCRRAAIDVKNEAETSRFGEIMQHFVSGEISEELYRKLEAEAKADRKKQRQERKQRAKPPLKRTSTDEQVSSVNVAELKKRIFNHNVSRENVIKALEALPSAERRSTIAGLPPGLVKKLGSYLNDKKS